MELTPDQKAMQEKLKNMSPQELKEFQKQQCIFCQMVTGKIQSRKVYEDDRVFAILDINPANPGHILLLPKEHYMILPQMPKADLDYIFNVAKDLSHALLRALGVEGTNIFVANGVAAGQKAQHFMIHIIPRMEGDNVGLELPRHDLDDAMMDLTQRSISEAIEKATGVKAPEIVERPEEEDGPEGKGPEGKGPEGKGPEEKGTEEKMPGPEKQVEGLPAEPENEEPAVEKKPEEKESHQHPGGTEHEKPHDEGPARESQEENPAEEDEEPAAGQTEKKDGHESEGNGSEGNDIRKEQPAGEGHAQDESIEIPDHHIGEGPERVEEPDDDELEKLANEQLEELDKKNHKKKEEKDDEDDIVKRRNKKADLDLISDLLR